MCRFSAQETFLIIIEDEKMFKLHDIMWKTLQDLFELNIIIAVMSLLIDLMHLLLNKSTN